MKAKEEHKKYLKKQKLSTIKVIFSQILILILFVTIWQVVSDKGMINAFLCSSAKKVIETIISLWENNLREPKLSNLIAISTYFSVTIDYLAGMD